MDNFTEHAPNTDDSKLRVNVEFHYERSTHCIIFYCIAIMKI